MRAADGGCDKCGNPQAAPAPHSGVRLCDACFVAMLMKEPKVAELAFPHGEYDLWADDDDVIGLTVARTYPKGLPIVRTEPPFMDAFDEITVGRFIAWCLTNSERLLAEMEASDA